MIILVSGTQCSACTELKIKLENLGLKEKVEEVNAYEDSGAKYVGEYSLRSIPVLINTSSGDMLMGSKLPDAQYEAFIDV